MKSRPNRPFVFNMALTTTMLAAFAISVLLTWEQLSMIGGGTSGITGCSGDGAGCSNVLSSEYGKVFGWPVSVWALGYFVILAGLLGWSFRHVGPLPNALVAGWSLPSVVAGAWFFVVMKNDLGQWCPWCLAVHILNLCFFCLAMQRVFADWERSKTATATTTDDTARPTTTRRQSMYAMVHGTALAAIAVVGQVTLYNLGVADPHLSIDKLDGVNNPLELAKIQRDEIQTRKVYATDKDPIHVVLFTCPNCQACQQTNDVLSKFQKAHPEIAVDVRFYPLSTQCNSAIAAKYPAKSDDGNACRKTEIALAVAMQKPTHFAMFVDWLYEHPKTDVSQVYQQAAALVGKKQLDTALASKEVKTRIERDLELAQQLNVTSVPAIFVEGGQVSGSLTPNSFFKLLQKMVERN